MTKVAIIVPNYNHERYLNLRLRSILNQTFQDFEIILLDDCSSDNSRQVIESYRGNPKISQVIYNESNTGSPFQQWVKGILLAQSEYIWIAESDDYADTEFLESLLDLATTYPDVGIAYCDSYKIDAQGDEIEGLHKYMDTDFITGAEEVKKHLCFYNTITNASSCIIKREYALKAISGLGEFKTCGDWIFYARVLQYSNLVYTSRKLNHYRWHENSVSYSAANTSSYIAEGINVVKYIDFRRVRFSLKEYMSLCKAWSRKIIKIDGIYLAKSLWILSVATFHFFRSRLIVTAKN